MLGIFKRIKIDKYFFIEEHSYTKKPKLKPGRAKWVLFLVTIAAVIFVLIAGAPTEEEERRSEAARAEARSETHIESHGEESSEASSGDSAFEDRLSVRHQGGVSSQRQFTASQLVKKSDTPGSSSDKLPIGTMVPAALVNTVLSSDQDSPVIAEVEEDVSWQNAVIIPKGTKAIGQGNLDDSTQRLRCRFHTMVYPDGSQHQFQGMALLADGSSGLPGNYNSGTFKKHSGQFLGNFVGGMAQGLKEKKAEGQAGITHEPGSIKNGLLNGVATSSLEYAQSSAQDMTTQRPYLEVPGTSPFLIYFEREYSP